MKTKYFIFCTATLGLLAMLLFVQPSGEPMVNSPVAVDHQLSKTAQKANAVRATNAEMRFQTIPWITDVFHGFRIAREENRPIFFYMVSGNPLDDC